MNYKDDPRYNDLLAAMCKFRGHRRFYEILAQIACTHADKNHDYSGDGDPLENFHECERYGISAIDGIITRISDKDSRFRFWIQRQRKGKDCLAIIDESIIDTLQDRTVYTMLLMILLEESIQLSQNLDRNKKVLTEEDIRALRSQNITISPTKN